MSTGDDASVPELVGRLRGSPRSTVTRVIRSNLGLAVPTASRRIQMGAWHSKVQRRGRERASFVQCPAHHDEA
jgi:hypothetical protein